MTEALSKNDPAPQLSLREPDTVMRLSRMGAFYPTRLSFMRSLIRRLSAEKTEVSRPVWSMDEFGYGHAVYSLSLGGYIYSLVAFSTPLEADQRSDRVIAEAWDTTYVLYDGVPSAADIDRLAANAPKQEAGRFQPTELVLSRANKSVRFFEHVVDRLSKGEQPDEELVRSVGYLLRTTAVYGNGKFGIADRERISDRPYLSGPFCAEMLSVWLTRGFSHDLAEYVAQRRAPQTFRPLNKRLKRHLGIGNSTGLGMAPFLVNHPILLNNWMVARETALARVQSVVSTDAPTLRRARQLAARAALHLDEWTVADDRQMQRIVEVRQHWAQVRAKIDSPWLESDIPWARLIEFSASLGLECQELVVSFVLELNGVLIDDLSDCMSSLVEPQLEPSMTVSHLRSLIEENFSWALNIDFSQPAETSLFWYVSEEKLEPRLGERYEEPGADRESPLDIARQVAVLARNLDEFGNDMTVASFLMRYPQHRHATRRIQAAVSHPYAEIRDNLIGSDCLPIDMLRCKLSFFGASKFDPKSDRWTRITLYQGAPCFDDIASDDADDWWLPVL